MLSFHLTFELLLKYSKILFIYSSFKIDNKLSAIFCSSEKSPNPLIFNRLFKKFGFPIQIESEIKGNKISINSIVLLSKIGSHETLVWNSDSKAYSRAANLSSKMGAFGSQNESISLSMEPIENLIFMISFVGLVL